MASYPTFKPSDYYDAKRYNSLSDNPAKPLINRATMSAYPPGSTPYGTAMPEPPRPSPWTRLTWT